MLGVYIILMGLKFHLGKTKPLAFFQSAPDPGEQGAPAGMPLPVCRQQSFQRRPG